MFQRQKRLLGLENSDPDPAAAEGVHPGAKSVNQWREAFLRDFANRMDRGKVPAENNQPPQ